MSKETSQSYIICAFCHKPTLEGKQHCQYCWSELGTGERVSTEEAAAIMQNIEISLKRSKNRKRLITAAVSVTMVFIIVFLLVFYNTELIVKPSPTVNSNSPANEWSMFRHDFLHSGTADVNAPLPQGTVQWTFCHRWRNTVFSGDSKQHGLYWFQRRQDICFERGYRPGTMGVSDGQLGGLVTGGS